MVLLFAISYLLIRGVGIWGINIPVAWGFAIVNFVWWIGIGHAGTLISAILLLLHQKWRTSINRFAEAMTLFAVACAGLFPAAAPGPAVVLLLAVPVPQHDGHLAAVPQPARLGRVRGHDLLHRVAAVLVRRPDPRPGDAARPLARAGLGRIVYGVLAMGWRGSACHWHRYETAYLLLAGLATPLVVSVHTVVSFDFAVAIVPGWHSTIFPPYFVAGAIFSGFAMVLTLAIPLRRSTAWRTSSPQRHLENMAKIMLATGLMVSYGYIIEAFMAWYSGEPLRDLRAASTASSAPTAPAYWLTIACNVAGPAGAVVQACALATSWSCSWSPSSSSSACGWSGSSSSSPACTATSCRRRGACTPARSGTGPRSSARSGCSSVPAVPVHPLPADDLDLRDADAAAARRRSRRRTPWPTESADSTAAGGVRRTRMNCSWRSVAAAPGGLPADGRLHAVPRRGAGGGAGLSPHARAAARASSAA